MPWCAACSKFFNPGAVSAGGACPECGRPLDRDAAVDTAEPPVTDDGVELDEPAVKVPWHFWIGVVAMVLYLGWRVVQGFIWAIT